MAIFLVRHGESEANVNPRVLQHKPDYLVALTSTGQDQAKCAGALLGQQIDTFNHDLTVISSPFERAVSTLDLMLSEMTSLRVKRLPESMLLAERQLGLVNTLQREYPIHFPKEYAEYKTNVARKASFFDRPVGGESPFDVCNRIMTFISLFEIERFMGDRDLIIVAHGGILKAFHHVLTHAPIQAYDEGIEPFNCDIWKYAYSNFSSARRWPEVSLNRTFVSSY